MVRDIMQPDGEASLRVYWSQQGIAFEPTTPSGELQAIRFDEIVGWAWDPAGGTLTLALETTAGRHYAWHVDDPWTGIYRDFVQDISASVPERTMVGVSGNDLFRKVEGEIRQSIGLRTFIGSHGEPVKASRQRSMVGRFSDWLDDPTHWFAPKVMRLTGLLLVAAITLALLPVALVWVWVVLGHASGFFK